MAVRSADVTIVLVTKTGESMPGFYVTAISAEHPSQTARASDHRITTFRLLPGDWRIYVEAGTLRQVTQPIIAVRSGRAQRVTVVLDPTVRCLIHP